MPVAVLALVRESRFAGTVTTEPPGAGGGAGIAGLPGTVSQAWVSRLSCTGAERDAAVAELHDLLLRTARFEISRRRGAFPQLAGADLDDLAWQSTDDALMSILRRPATSVGTASSRPGPASSPSSKPAPRSAGHAWRGREIPLTPAFWSDGCR